MSLKETLLGDLKKAMKEKDNITKSTVTMVRAAILQIEKDNKVELGDEEIIDVVSKQVKQRKDALSEFEKAGREDLVEETKAELNVLMKYLPKQLSKEEVKSIVENAVEKVGAKSVKDMGKIMSEVMPKIKGKADGKLVNEIARELLS
ncbi:GatB/YqeY domain-containing protein [Anaerofustis sp.]|uniref:GatB/YqeY domain-containing protein n=1 Tax=Anaerofustis sp. TaxID=1872517 RepID=UPI0025BC9705|nr:GatB/YqeY domain-containing protein [Anaerofustis sp.]